MYEVALYDDCLEINHSVLENKITLKYEKITDVFHGYKTQLKEINKSVIGRAVAGGLLFGGVGAVVGSISGTGTKTKKEKNLYLIISYIDSDGNEQFLQFEDTRLYKGAKLAKTLKKVANISEKVVNDIQL